jgi:hypothetical protein
MNSPGVEFKPRSRKGRKETENPEAYWQSHPFIKDGERVSSLAVIFSCSIYVPIKAKLSRGFSKRIRTVSVV